MYSFQEIWNQPLPKHKTSSFEDNGFDFFSRLISHANGDAEKWICREISCHKSSDRL